MGQNKIRIKSLAFTEERNKRIKGEIERLYDLEWYIVTSKSRKIEIIEARRVYCALLRNVFGLPLQTIGKMANTHHATVMHSVKMHNTYSELYKGYDDNYNKIKKTLVDKNSIEYFMDELKHLEKMKNKIQKQIDSLVQNQAQNLITKNE